MNWEVTIFYLDKWQFCVKMWNRILLNFQNFGSTEGVMCPRPAEAVFTPPLLLRYCVSKRGRLHPRTLRLELYYVRWAETSTTARMPILCTVIIPRAYQLLLGLTWKSKRPKSRAQWALWKSQKRNSHPIAVMIDESSARLDKRRRRFWHSR
jgi:hypothetical protein